MPEAALDVRHLFGVLKHFGTTMLVTRGSASYARARPMAVAELGEDAHVYLVTGADSEKTAEIDLAPDVTLVFQDSHRFASLSGRATLSRDRALTERLWSEAWKVWFPQGKADPAICFVRIEPHEAEYWDNAGMNGLKYLFAAAKAYASGTRPGASQEQHARLKL